MNGGMFMTQIIMLGTGHGATMDLYNTCFAIQNKQGVFLIDTGGSVEILKRLSHARIPLSSINHIFISHSHTDHILGFIWMFKKLGVMAMHGELEGKLNVYCNDVVYEAILEISKYVFPKRLVQIMNEVVNFVILNDGDKYVIHGIEYQFFDILAKGTKQFGFECQLENQRFLFLGDEPLNEKLYDRVSGADYVTHEAFCLDREEPIFNAYEKNHSTALSVARTMNELGVKNLILYHTEESHKENRKQLYIEEAKQVFSGNVLVPDDLEVIQFVTTK